MSHNWAGSLGEPRFYGVVSADQMIISLFSTTKSCDICVHKASPEYM